MKKVVKTRAFKDRLKGHKDGVISLFSEGPTAEMLFSASKDGWIRCSFINFLKYLILTKNIIPEKLQKNRMALKR